MVILPVLCQRGRSGRNVQLHSNFWTQPMAHDTIPFNFLAFALLSYECPEWVFPLLPNFSTCFYCSWQNCTDISHLYEKWHFLYLYMQKSSFQLLGNYFLHTLGNENHSFHHLQQHSTLTMVSISTQKISWNYSSEQKTFYPLTNILPNLLLTQRSGKPILLCSSTSLTSNTPQMSQLFPTT